MSEQPTERVKNPFGDTQGVAVQPAQQEGMMQARTQGTLGEIQAAVFMAKQYPRDKRMAMDNILNDCTRETLAEKAIYSYPRGGVDVTGPSIRLAEVLAQNWGNIRFETHELERRATASTAEAFCWDLETNVRASRTFEVPHFRDTRQGRVQLKDDRDIKEQVQNQGARHVRACILSIIPGDVTEAALQQCATTQAQHTDVSPAGIKTMVETFKEFDVTADDLQRRLGRNLESIRPAQYLQLKNIYRSLRDGMSSKETWFPAAPETPTMPDDAKPTDTAKKVQDELLGGKKK